MFNKDSLVKVKTLRENSRQRVELMEDSLGKKYLKRVIFSDKRKIYRKLKGINHPGIPKVHLVEFESDTVVYEDYIDAITLAEFMEKNNHLNKKDVYDVAIKILSALETLHSADIIHKDIKPDNILIDDSLNVWLTDFDISRIYQKEMRCDTDTYGTFGYAPIEQYGVLPTDYKTDIYSFGVTLESLLDCYHIDGRMRRVAGKCKKLDPAERYSSAGHVKKALNSGRKSVLVLAIALALAVGIIIVGVTGEKTKVPSDNKTSDKTHASSENVVTDSGETALGSDSDKDDSGSEPEPWDNGKDDSGINTDDTTETENSAENFDGDFSGFGYGTNEEVYSRYSNYSDICIFTMPTSWEHLIFTDEISKNGRLKLGVENSIVNAGISFCNGVLSVDLNDNYGNSFNKAFSIPLQNGNQDTKINADIVCYDFDGDGGSELLIGLSQGVTGSENDYFYNIIDYCLGWCIRYDRSSGFVLCSGEMTSKDQSFWISDNIRKINVPWEDFDDVTGYFLEGDTIKPVR